MAGIRVAGKNHFVIAPVPGGTLTCAKASYHSIYGRVESRWQKTADGFTLTVTIPANTTAEIRLPNGMEHSVSAGTYTYSF